MEEKYDPMKWKYDPMEERYDPMEERYDPMKWKYDPMEERYDPMEWKYDPVEHGYDPMECKGRLDCIFVQNAPPYSGNCFKTVTLDHTPVCHLFWHCSPIFSVKFQYI